MFTFILLCFSVIQFNWFEFNLPSLCKVDTPRPGYCRNSLLPLQGVVLLAMACPVVLWLYSAVIVLIEYIDLHDGLQQLLG